MLTVSLPSAECQRTRRAALQCNFKVNMKLHFHTISNAVRIVALNYSLWGTQRLKGRNLPSNQPVGELGVEDSHTLA